MLLDNSIYFKFCKKLNVLKNFFYFFLGGLVLVMEKIFVENCIELEFVVINDFVMIFLL